MIPLRDTVPSRSFPFVNWLLIVLNVLMFVVILSLRSDAEGLVAALGLVPKRLLTSPQPWEFVTPLVPLFFLPWFVQNPATIYLGFWFLSQLLNGVLTVVKGQQAMGGVAWWAHVGGFLAGLAFGPLFARRPLRRAYVDEHFPW